MPLPKIYDLVHDVDSHYGKYVHSAKYFLPQNQKAIYPILGLVGLATTAGIISSMKHLFLNTHVSVSHTSYASWNKQAPVAFDVATVAGERPLPQAVFHSAD